jgi:cellulose synthase/poly-beta-1,6-N-acetylglucosamine synthase-like glycosyltransferase
MILALFAWAIFIQLAYYLLVYLRVAWHKKKQNAPEMNETPPVSVIICARNEEENLILNLTSVLEQDYPSFEVIVVNDCSEDDTEQVLAGLKQKYPHLRSTIIKKDGSFRNGKKFAATVGIKAAQHEWLLFTDADCRPESKQWIASMSRHFIDGKDIVLGYGGYLAQKGYLNKWIRYDTCFIALQYFAFAKMGKAYMGVGRNLAYRKSLFFAHNGFAAHAHILSGDDDLFVNQAATKRNVAVTYAREAHIRSIPKKTFKEWIWQKSRHITTSKYYRGSQTFWLTLEPFSRVLMWASAVSAFMLFCPFWQYILIALTVRMILFMSVIGVVAKRFNEPGILKHALFFDIAIPFVYLYVFLLNRVSSKHNKWK